MVLISQLSGIYTVCTSVFCKADQFMTGQHTADTESRREPCRTDDWAYSLPLAEALSDLLCLQLPPSVVSETVNPEATLKQIVDLEHDEKKIDKICSDFNVILKKLLKQEIANLRTAITNQSTYLNQLNGSEKFNMSQMKCGTIADFL